MRGLITAGVLWALLLVMGTADAQTSRRQRNKLEQSQIALTAAIRWGDFEAAWQMVDPAYRQAHPLSDVELSRYEQVQISGYRDLSSQLEADDTVTRNIELRVINKHTMAERTLRYQEHWRWDAENKGWWLVTGLPDLWNGQ
ncbi:hypothetical protein [Pseudoxanthomonas dokdonensis]|uniref:DUF4440 domain-containing protein n=1 Tax=Pseudoxanthomonas dokdonensis TaxID=344882 RepID=A0A0R0CRC7_9GAMM|nr:hypothetical protein [Pseudoxanthomonas dokdonensis]KRG71979.1 hypothetical protein ABB29_00480 [Pseudoxanthomonas dokdonensis]